MKTNLMRNAAKVTLLAAAMLATCFFSGPANAQSDFQGKFTLQYETRWGKAVLPAGDYLLTFDFNSPGPMLVILDAKSGLVVALESIDDREGRAVGESALLVATQGKQQVVQSLTIAELDEAFVYERPPAQGRPMKEAGQTQAIAVLVAKK